MLQITINNYLRRAFCPHEESRLLNQMLNIVGNGIQYAFYKRYFDTLADKVVIDSQDWFIYTVNAYYDLAIHNWSMIFGAYSEPTHYSKLIENENINRYLCQITSCEKIDKDTLKNYLLNCIGLSKKEYEDVHKKIKNYRNKYLAHREHHPSKINDGDLFNPELNVIIKALKSIYLLLIKIIHFFPDFPNKNYSHYVSYVNINSQEDFEEFLKLTLPDFKKLFSIID